MSINNTVFTMLMDDTIDVALLMHIPSLIQPVHGVWTRDRGVGKCRNTEYFENMIPAYTDIQFKEHFRMTRSAFEVLLQVIGNNMEPHAKPNMDTPLQKKVLFSIWLLSKPESFLAVGDRFNIPTSSGHGIFKSIVHTLADLMPNYVKWPNAAQQAVSSLIFEERSCGLRNVVGAIDGCHIATKQPAGNASDFFNRKQVHSIILQGVCDHTLRFIDVFIGMPGKMHDTRVFRNSPIFEKLTECLRSQDPFLRREQHLLGDCAYPRMINLMTPFRDNGHLSASHVRYNTRLSSIRSTIERAFGLLKVKFRRLKYLDIADVCFANKIIAACCMLHNFIIDNGETDDYQLEFSNMRDYSIDDKGQEHSLPSQEAVLKRLRIVNSL